MNMFKFDPESLKLTHKIKAISRFALFGSVARVFKFWLLKWHICPNYGVKSLCVFFGCVCLGITAKSRAY